MDPAADDSGDDADDESDGHGGDAPDALLGGERPDIAPSIPEAPTIGSDDTDDPDDADDDDDDDDGPAAPEAPDATLDDVDVDPWLRNRFWILVLIVKGALLTTTLGVLFVTFEANHDLGGRLIIAGGLLSVAAVLYYRRTKRELAERDDADAA